MNISSYSDVTKVPNTYFAPLETLTGSYRQSINSIPENVTYFHGDDNLESTRGALFQVNTINERLRVVDIAISKAPKTPLD